MTQVLSLILFGDFSGISTKETIKNFYQDTSFKANLRKISIDNLSP